MKHDAKPTHFGVKVYVSGEFFSCAHLCIFDFLIFAPTFAFIARFRSTAEKHAKTAKKDFLTDVSLVVKKNWGSVFLGVFVRV